MGLQLQSWNHRYLKCGRKKQWKCESPKWREAIGLAVGHNELLSALSGTRCRVYGPSETVRKEQCWVGLRTALLKDSNMSRARLPHPCIRTGLAASSEPRCSSRVLFPPFSPHSNKPWLQKESDQLLHSEKCNLRLFLTDSVSTESQASEQRCNRVPDLTLSIQECEKTKGSFFCFS